MKENLRIIISGGGTGGHIFPAVSIANAIKELHPQAEILFVGAEGRMEMQRVPEAGYTIVGLPVSGFDRSHLLRNIPVLFRLLKSQWKAWRIIRRFKPHVAVGVGGYASGPTLKMAGLMGVPTLIQEQNSYAGVTNKLLAKKAKKICVAYEGMEKFFAKEKIILTGNPVRQNLLVDRKDEPNSLLARFEQKQGRVVLILGGSLGARTMNESVIANLDKIRESGVRFIWQTGKAYIDRAKQALEQAGDLPMLYATDFITRMDEAYAAADLIVSRAGAGSISEFSLLGKPVLLVPSPNVAEDHQTKNALALVNKDAAIYIKDSEAVATLIDTAIRTVGNDARLSELSANISRMALPDAAAIIAKEVYKLAETYSKEK